MRSRRLLEIMRVQYDHILRTELIHNSTANENISDHLILRRLRKSDIAYALLRLAYNRDIRAINRKYSTTYTSISKY